MKDIDDLKNRLKKDILKDLQPTIDDLKEKINNIKDEIKKTIAKQVRDLLEKSLK